MANKQIVYKAIEIVAALAGVVLLIMWMAGSFSAKIEPGVVEVRAAVAPANAQTAKVEEEPVPVTEEAAGTVQATRKTVVSSRIVGVIAEVHVRAGDEVKQGDVLVVLDDRELIAHAQEAQRGVDAADASRKKAENDFRRAQQLLARGVVSQSEFDQAESAFHVAQAEAERAAQALRAAQVTLTYAEIKAQVPGRITDRYADPGDTALPGTPLIGLYDPTALRIEVPLRETLLPRIHIGQSLQVRLGTEAETLEGTVDEIVPQAEAGSRTFLVKVGLPKRQGLYTGMFGRVLIPAGERTRLLVPETAVERIGQLDFVYVVGGGRQIERRLATMGLPAGDGRVEVLSGLRPGDIVLLRSQVAEEG